MYSFGMKLMAMLIGALTGAAPQQMKANPGNGMIQTNGPFYGLRTV